MDAQFLITLAQFLLVAILLLVCANLYLVLKLKEIDPFARWDGNKIHPNLFMAFWIFGVVAIAYATGVWWDEMIMVQDAASEHGQRIDSLFWVTMAVAVFVTLVTNTLLFYYAWKYRTEPGKKALFYPHNNRLELLWTVVPAVVLSLLVFNGVIVWHDIMGDAPEDSLQVELNAKQFDWTIRYPGQDMEFGETNVKYMNDATTNQLGFNFDDRRGHDDVVATELHLPVNRPVKFSIKSRDVLHSATIAHFRMKMDAVPGMTTSFWLTPSKTTAQMREELGDENFNYEMSCQQICGGAHWNMRRVVVVETWEEYQAWLAKQKPFYAQYKEINGIETPATTTADARQKEENKSSLDVAVSVNP